jgi:hypothetical protein
MQLRRMCAIRGPARAPALCLILAAAGGCQQSSARLGDDAALTTFVELVRPRQIEIQRHFTKPVSYEGSGDADGLEVIVAAKDASGDEVKCVGEFLFELYEQRLASGDPLGKRVAYWAVSVDSADSVQLYWDSLSRFFKFPLRFEQQVLAPGRYVLTAQLAAPGGAKLRDDYDFSYRAGSARSSSIGS